MGSRTIMKQQIMRQMVMNEEKPQKETVNMTNERAYTNIYKGSFNNISQSSDCLPSLTSTIVASEKHFDYCKPFLSNTNNINFNHDQNNSIVDDFPILNIEYNDPIRKIDSPYLLQNMYPIDHNYNLQSFNDFSQQSSVMDNNVDSNSYNHPYQNLNNKLSNMGPMTDLYGYETSFSCPVTRDQTTSSCTQRRMSNSNSAGLGGMSLNYDEKRSQMKERNKKESHNRIERKRRDFINQQIVELSNLLPVQMMTEGESKKNKGNILKNSVVYIQHLQIESNNTSNYIKETDLSFALIENYRKQIQELQQQISTVNSKDVPPLSERYNNSESYNQYLVLHEQNRRTFQLNNQLLVPPNNGLSSENPNRLYSSSYNKSPLSTLENGSPFKIEPSSAHSSLGNNSVSTTYHRIDEDPGVVYNSFNDMLSPSLSGNPNQIYSSTGNDPFFNSNNHFRGARYQFESMEC